jgi:hypothetical protein
MVLWTCSSPAGQGEWVYSQLFPHAALGIMNVKTSAYDGELDLFKSSPAGQGEWVYSQLFPHAALGIMNVKTSAYDGALDLFKPCRAG